MKTQSEIERSLSQMFFSLQDKVTSYAKISVIRAILVSVSASLADIWNEVTQIKRKIFPQTATGTDLDTLLGEVGGTRRSAVALSTICVFSATKVDGTSEIELGTSSSVGTNALNDTSKTWTVNKYAGWKLYASSGILYTIASNTATQIIITGTPAAGVYYIFPVVPEGTAILSNVSGTRYFTTAEVIVGFNNPGLLGGTKSVALGNRAIVTCEVLGSQGQARANELTVFETAISGVTSVTNPIPTQPRTFQNAESDDDFRRRTSLYFALSNVGTQAFYEAAAVQGNAKVVRVIVKHIPLTNTITINVATRSGELLTSPELTALATAIGNKTRAFDTIEVLNVVPSDIYVSFTCALPSDITLRDYYTQVADALANYLDYGKWNPENAVLDDDVLVKIKAVNNKADIDLTSFYVEGSKTNVVYATKKITFTDSFPRFARLKITDSQTATTIDYVLSSYPIAEQTDALLNPYGISLGQ